MADEDEPYRKLLFGVRRSVRYHFRRQRFFDAVNTSLLLAAAVAGFATTVGVVSEMYTLARGAGIVTGMTSALQLIFTPGGLARLHNDLAREFIQLEKRAIVSGSSALEDLQAERLGIEAREPPHYRTLNLICHNELVRAMGGSEREYVDIPRLGRMLAHFTDLGSGDLDKRLRQGPADRRSSAS